MLSKIQQFVHIGKKFLPHSHFITKHDLIRKMSSIDQIVVNNKTAEDILEILKTELSSIQKKIAAIKKSELLNNNAILLKEVEDARNELIHLEIKNGKKQIPIPGIASFETVEDDRCPPPAINEDAISNSQKDSELPTKPQKEKKTKKEKQPTSVSVDKSGGNQLKVPEDALIDVGRLDIRVGRIVEVSKHPDADSLYLEKIDCGEANPRTVVSGLVKFVPIDEMQNRMVIVLCNLKPAKMRGIASEGMVLCASTPEKVEILSPPAGAEPGDLVHCEGFDRRPDEQLNPKKKIFETCAPDLLTNDKLEACFKKSPLFVPGKGSILTASLKNVNVK